MLNTNRLRILHLTQERDHNVDNIQHTDQSTYEFAMWEGWPSPQYASTMVYSDTLEIQPILSGRIAPIGTLPAKTIVSIQTPLYRCPSK